MAITEEIFIDVEASKATEDVNKLNQSVKNVKQSTQDLQKTTKTTKAGFKGVSTAVKALGTALKAAGIGLVITLFAKLGELLSQNQKVTDALNTVWTSLSLAFQDFFSLFEGGLPSISEFGKSIRDNIIERFKSALNITGLLGKGLKQLFEGDFAGIKNTLAEVGTEFGDFVTGIDGFNEKAADYVSNTLDAAKATVQLSNDARIAEAELRGLIEKFDFQAEVQRRIRDDFEKTAEERLAANQRLKEILDEQEAAQLRLAQISIDSARAQIKANGDNVENRVALIEAENEYAATLAQVAGFRAEQEAQDRALRKELLEFRKEEIATIISTENLRLEAKKESLDQEVKATLLATQREAEIRENAAREEEQRAEYLEDFKLNIAQAGLASLSNLAEQGSVFAKGVAIAQAVISTFQGMNKALAETTDPTPTQSLRFANAAAVGIAGFANVANILKQQPIQKGGGGGASTPSQPAAPSFNIVGEGGINQLAQTINQEPVQAFVVGSNVTTQQEMDRNIVSTATIG